MIDAIDRKIIAALQKNARITNADIAQLVGLAPSATHERVKKLLRVGVIESFEAKVNPAAVGAGTLAFVFVRTSEKAGQSTVGRRLAQCPEILEVHNVAGEDCYLVKVRVADTQALSRFLRKKVGVIPGVVSTRTTIAMETYKETGVVHFESHQKSAAEE